MSARLVYWLPFLRCDLKLACSIPIVYNCWPVLCCSCSCSSVLLMNHALVVMTCMLNSRYVFQKKTAFRSFLLHRSLIHSHWCIQRKNLVFEFFLFSQLKIRKENSVFKIRNRLPNLVEICCQQKFLWNNNSIWKLLLKIMAYRYTYVAV